MPASNSTMIHKLQQAINSRGYKILYNKTQFFSDKQNRPVTMYIIKQVIPNEDPEKRNKYIELFSTTSQIQIVLFLRDFWYDINGWEIPADNEMWNEAKQKYYDKKSSENVKEDNA